MINKNEYFLFFVWLIIFLAIADKVTITQLGSGNDSQLLQAVNNSRSNIVQDGSGNILHNSDLESGTSAESRKSTLELDQIADNNILGLYQNIQNNLADVYQNGNGNMSDVWESAIGGAVSGNIATTTQLQNSSEASAYQKEDLSGIAITQDGNSSHADISHDGPGYGSLNADMNNKAEVEQEGDGQSATVDQYGSDNESKIVQFGNGSANHIQIEDGTDNDALAESSWGLSTGFQEQYESGNTSILKQNGYHSATTIQDGENNYSRLRQASGSSTAMFDQLGDDNQINADQSGAGNMMTVDQTGTGHKAGTIGFTNRGLFQYGDNNMIELAQTGSYNSAYVYQDGNNNMADVTQSN